MLIYVISIPFRDDKEPAPDVQNPDPTATAVYGPPQTAKAPVTSVRAKTNQEAWAKHLGAEVETTNSIGMKMLLIPPGEFTMGSPDSDRATYFSEKPRHFVKVSKPFYLCVYEVTHQQYQKVMELDRSQGLRPLTFGPDLPATYVSWNDAV